MENTPTMNVPPISDAQDGGGLADSLFFFADEDHFAADEGKVERNESKKSKKSNRLSDELGKSKKRKKKKKKKRSSMTGHDSSGAFSNQSSSTGLGSSLTGHDSSAIFDNQPSSAGFGSSDSEGSMGMDVLRSTSQGQKKLLAVPEFTTPRKFPAETSAEAILATDLWEDVVSPRKVPVAAHENDSEDDEAFVQHSKSSLPFGDVSDDFDHILAKHRPVSWQHSGTDALATTSEKQSMLDEFASFAGASLAGHSNGDEASETLSQPRELSLGPSSLTSLETTSHKLLVSYLLSMGTPRELAEDLTFRFLAEQNFKHQGSQSARQIDHTSPSISSATAPSSRQIARAATTSKLDDIARSERRSYTNGGPAAADMLSGSAGSPFGAYNTALLRTASSRRRAYMRVPGSMQMQGRAFGAPALPQVPDPGPERGIEEDQPPTGNAAMVEAKVVDDETPVVYADQVTFKTIFQEGPMRKFAILALVVLACSITVICVLLLIRPDSNPSLVEGTLAPSGAPTFIIDAILTAAGLLSGWEITVPESPQFKAVGWMSTFDEVDHGDYGDAFAQRYVMTVFYLSTKGEAYLDREDWLNPQLHECGWSSGIYCLPDITNRLVVVGLDLTRNGVSGIFPHEIGLLSGLATIRLPQNRIIGTIPQELFALSNLETLDLRSNLITGQLPLNLDIATELTSLILSDNDISGLLPNALWNLTNLRTLDLSSNRLSGTIPEEINDMQVLVTLDLRKNLIHGSFPNLSSLQKLDFVLLDYNHLTGTFHSFDAALVRRQVVGLSNNRLVGKLPSINPGEQNITDFALIRIRTVDLSYNFLTGTINPAISFIPTLRHVDLSGNMLSGTFDDRIGWPSLEYMAAANNLLTGTVPVLWPETLTHLDMSGNDMNGTIPTQLCNFPDLETLILSGNPFERGTIPSCLANLVKLRDFEISGAQLSGKIPSQIDQLSDLNVLDISNNGLTGTLPSMLGRLSKMVRLHLDENNFRGSIPSEFGSMNLIQKLYLDFNLLTGTVPSSFVNLDELQELTLSDNALSGSVPEGMCSFESINLTYQDVGCNLVCDCCGDANICP